MGVRKNDGKDNKGKKDTSGKRGGFPWILIFLLLMAAGGAALFFHPASRGAALGAVSRGKAAIASVYGSDGEQTDKNERSADATIRLQRALIQKFEELEMRDSLDYAIQYLPKENAVAVAAKVPRGRPIEWIIWHLSSAASAPYGVEDCACAAETRCEMTFAAADAALPRVSLTIQQTGRYLSNTAKMAILIENFGFEATHATIEYLTFPEPLTVSLIPARKLAAWTAQIADEYKKEIVLSLPLEPLPPQFAEYKDALIMVHYDEQRIRGIMAQAAAAVPNFSGVANFYGSRAMEDSRVMEIILSEVGKRKAYFVYSDASYKKSVAPQLSRSMKVRSHPVQGTIDASHTAEQARERMRRYAMAAEKTGKILIKAQPSPAFIQVLKEETPRLRDNGIRLVYVSELMTP